MQYNHLIISNFNISQLVHYQWCFRCILFQVTSAILELFFKVYATVDCPTPIYQVMDYEIRRLNLRTILPVIRWWIWPDSSFSPMYFIQLWNYNNQTYRVISENKNRSYIWNGSENFKTLYKCKVLLWLSLYYYCYNPFLLSNDHENTNFYRKSSCQA